MKNTGDSDQDSLRFSLRVETLISAFQEAADASLIAGQQLEKSIERGADELTLAHLNQEIVRAEYALFAALQKICSYQTTSLIEVHKKLGLWHENTCADGAAVATLSPMDKLVQSAYDDIGRMLAA